MNEIQIQRRLQNIMNQEIYLHALFTAITEMEKLGADDSQQYKQLEALDLKANEELDDISDSLLEDMKNFDISTNKTFALVSYEFQKELMLAFDEAEN